MQHTYFITWPRTMKICQIDVFFTVTRLKMKRRVTYKDSFKDIILHYILQNYLYRLPCVCFSSFCGSVLRQDSSEPSLVLVKPRNDTNNMSCRCDMTEILLKAA